MNLVKFVLYFREKNENKQKRGRVWPKKQFYLEKTKPKKMRPRMANFILNSLLFGSSLLELSKWFKINYSFRDNGSCRIKCPKRSVVWRKQPTVRRLQATTTAATATTAAATTTCPFIKPQRSISQSVSNACEMFSYFCNVCIPTTIIHHSFSCDAKILLLFLWFGKHFCKSSCA